MEGIVNLILGIMGIELGSSALPASVLSIALWWRMDPVILVTDPFLHDRVIHLHLTKHSYIICMYLEFYKVQIRNPQSESYGFKQAFSEIRGGPLAPF